MGKSWPSDENNSDAHDCTTWQALISWYTSLVNTTSAFRSHKMLPHHQPMLHQYFGPVASCYIIAMPHYHIVYVKQCCTCEYYLIFERYHIYVEYSFILLLKFSTILSSKMPSVLLSDFSLVMK